MNQKKVKLIRKFSNIKGIDDRGYQRAKKFYKQLNSQEKEKVSEEFRGVVTAKQVWDFLNIYYKEHKTTPGLGVIRAELRMLGPTGENKLRRALKTLTREQYIRISKQGNRVFIVLVRTGGYR